MFKYNAARSVEQMAAKAFTNLVANVIAGNGCKRYNRQQTINIKFALGSKDTGAQQKRVSREEKAHEHTGLSEDYERDEQQAAGLDYVGNIEHLLLSLALKARRVQLNLLYCVNRNGRITLNMTKDSISLTLDKREVTGKAVKHLRSAGTVPAVIHDHGKPSLHVQGDAIAMLKVWRAAGKHHPVELKTGDLSFTALIKDAEFDPRKHLLKHIVFNAVDKNQKVEAEIPLRPRYDEGNESSPAERTGYIVLSQLETVQVRAISSKLPDFLEYDAEKLVEIGDHATVADLIIPEGVELISEAEQSIATVYEPSALAAANDAAGGDAEPEDVAEVESDTESYAEEGTQAAEDRPGGKGQDEPKTASIEAAKADKN